MIACIKRFFGRTKDTNPLPLAEVTEAWMSVLRPHYRLGHFACAQNVRWIGETVYGPAGYDWGMHRVSTGINVSWQDPRGAHAILYVSDGVHCWWADVTGRLVVRDTLDAHGEPISRLMTPKELAGGYLADYPEGWRP